MNVINPATGELLATLQEDTASTLIQKYELLKEAQPQWAAESLEQRIAVLQRFEQLLQQHTERLAAVLTSEVGKPLQQSVNEINGARSRIQWLTSHAAAYLQPEVMTSTDTLEERIVYEPLGVIGNISAWNYPYLVGVNVFVPALLAGNAVLYKPSEFASLTGLEIGRLLYEAGVPEHVFQVAIGGGSTGEGMLELPLSGYFFTGSYKTGQYIYEKVAPKMVPCQCELGGKDPLYVADDVADVAAVAAATADGAFYNNGQSCCAVERIYVQEKIYDAYVEAFVKEVKSWKMGLPTEPGVYIGALTRPAQIELLSHQIADARAKGASVLTGGEAVHGPGNYFEPTVLVNVNHSMDLMREESFGPIIGIMKVKDDAEAIRQMADTQYGLTAAVYSSSAGRAQQILAQLNTGTGYWNCCDRVSAALPWSGRGHSGFGATLSHAGLRAFTHPKAYHLRK
ncbi:MAG: aldehyde dehydrogenase family protein [Chitinophagaceae bacterium]|nr:aldehyde dehydrogenase family protein [Chitinophagaceae bacterium]